MVQLAMRAFLFLILIFPTFSFGVTGKELLSDCSTDVSTYARGACSGYLKGTMTTYDLFIGTGAYFCPPANLTMLEVERIVVTFLEQNLDYLHLPASSMVLNALTLKFAASERDGGFTKFCPE